MDALTATNLLHLEEVIDAQHASFKRVYVPAHNKLKVIEDALQFIEDPKERDYQAARIQIVRQRLEILSLDFDHVTREMAGLKVSLKDALVTGLRVGPSKATKPAARPPNSTDRLVERFRTPAPPVASLASALFDGTPRPQAPKKRERSPEEEVHLEQPKLPRRET